MHQNSNNNQKSIFSRFEELRHQLIKNQNLKSCMHVSQKQNKNLRHQCFKVIDKIKSTHSKIVPT